MEVRPCKECPDAVTRYTFDGKEYVLVHDMYVSFYTMALMLFSDVPDVKERLDRAMGPIPGPDGEIATAQLAMVHKEMVGGIDAEMRKGMR